MAKSEVYWMQSYRRQPGDIGIDDLPISQNIEATPKKKRLGY